MEPREISDDKGEDTEHLQYNNSQNDLRSDEVWPPAPKTLIESPVLTHDPVTNQRPSTIRNVALFFAGLLPCYYISSYICAGLWFMLRVPPIIALLVTLVIVGIVCFLLKKSKFTVLGIIIGALVMAFLTMNVMG